MDFDFTPKVDALRAQLARFMDRHVHPNETRYESELAEARFARVPPVMTELKARAREAGLWNLFLHPGHPRGPGLTNLEYAPLCELMGRCYWAPEVFNCSAPDTGNMETLDRFGTEAQKSAWLEPLLDGEIRSAFAMTEPQVASSDATNIESRIERDGDGYVVNGRKWWISGAGHANCRILIFMGKTDPDADRHRQQSMILIPIDTPGVRVLRPMTVFGNEDWPRGHMEILFEDVRVPASSLLLGEGRGFEIAQARLGPGRIHHCMRLVGLAERALEAMCDRVESRVAFGRPLSKRDTIRADIAVSRIEIEQARLLVLKAADRMDKVGNKVARTEIAMIKAAVPGMAQRVVDRAIQAHGAAGLSQDFFLARAFMYARTTRLSDGPDEVHRNQIARLELARQAARREEDGRS